MAYTRKNLADRAGATIDVAFQDTGDGLASVHHVDAAPSIESRLDAIEAALGGTLTAQLSGRSAVLLPFFSGVQLRDTATQNSAVVDLLPYRDVGYYARNSHNQPVTLYFSPYGTVGVRLWDGVEWTPAEREVTLPASSDLIYVLHSRFPWLRAPADSMRVGVKASVAPTSGSLTLQGVGVPI